MNNIWLFEYKKMKNDAGLIFIEKPFEINDQVRLACLPKTSFSYGSTCYASGWGDTNTDDNGKGVDADHLMTAPLKTIDKPECYQAMAKKFENTINNETFKLVYDELGPGGICASNSPKSVCSGDSGGPLICNQNGKAVVHGIASAVFFGIYTHGQKLLIKLCYL